MLWYYISKVEVHALNSTSAVNSSSKAYMGDSYLYFSKKCFKNYFYAFCSIHSTYYK